MIVAVALFELHIEHAQSLKDKRMVVRSLRDKMRRHFQIAVNEVGLHDVHQRARIACALIADRHGNADKMLEAIQNYIEDHTDAVVAGWTHEKLDFDEDAGL
jgi:uncharacterized protein YlxP (DUF503 family)